MSLWLLWWPPTGSSMFMVVVMLLMYSVLHCLYSVGNKITITKWSLWKCSHIRHNHDFEITIHFAQELMTLKISDNQIKIEHHPLYKTFVKNCVRCCQNENFWCSQQWKNFIKMVILPILMSAMDKTVVHMITFIYDLPIYAWIIYIYICLYTYNLGLDSGKQ